jgi:hypothetical protein
VMVGLVVERRVFLAISRMFSMLSWSSRNA